MAERCHSTWCQKNTFFHVLRQTSSNNSAMPENRCTFKKIQANMFHFCDLVQLHEGYTQPKQNNERLTIQKYMDILDMSPIINFFKYGSCAAGGSIVQ